VADPNRQTRHFEDYFFWSLCGSCMHAVIPKTNLYECIFTTIVSKILCAKRVPVSALVVCLRDSTRIHAESACTCTSSSGIHLIAYRQLFRVLDINHKQLRSVAQAIE
jgi:hypothetical protein